MRMRAFAIGGFVLGIATLPSLPAAAVCSGAAAPIALKAFNDAPAAWLEKNKGGGDIGAQAQALAATAVNVGDADFGKNLALVLGSASGDDGAAIGTALGSLVKTCSDPKDPGDRLDKQYIAENIERNLLTNAAANTAYGRESGPETSAVAAAAAGDGTGTGAGASGAGTSATSSGLPTGGTNSGVIVDGSTSTLTVFGALQTGSVGSLGASAAATTAASTGTSTLSSTLGTTSVTCTGVLIAICGNGTINGNITLGIYTASNTSTSNSQMTVH